MKIIKNILLVLLVLVILSTGAYAAACNVQGEVFDSKGGYLSQGAAVDCVLYRAGGNIQTYTTTTGTGFPPAPLFYHLYKCDMNCENLGGEDVIEVIVHDPINPGTASIVMSSSTTYLNVTLGQRDNLKANPLAQGGGSAAADLKIDVKIINTSYNYDPIIKKLSFNLTIENKLSNPVKLFAHFTLKDLNRNNILNFTQPISLNSLEKRGIIFSGQGHLDPGSYNAGFSLYHKDELIDAAAFEVLIVSEEDLPPTEQTKEFLKDEISKISLKITKNYTFISIFILLVLFIALIIYYFKKKKRE